MSKKVRSDSAATGQDSSAGATHVPFAAIAQPTAAAMALRKWLSAADSPSHMENKMQRQASSNVGVAQDSAAGAMRVPPAGAEQVPTASTEEASKQTGRKGRSIAQEPPRNQPR